MNFSMGKALLSHFNFLVIRVIITGMNIIATTTYMHMYIYIYICICADARCFNYVHDVVCFRVTLHVAGTLDDQHGTDYDY
jgi:hypothetical protein